MSKLKSCVYLMLIDKANKDGAYSTCFPDFPGLISSGKSTKEAILNGRKALAFHINEILKNKEEMPESRTFRQILTDEDIPHDIMFKYITACMPDSLENKDD